MGHLKKDSYVFDDINLYTETKSNIESETHFHDFYEFFYVIQGTVKHTINNKTETLKIGDLRFIPPMVSHSIYSNGGSLHRDIVIPKEYFETLCQLLAIKKSFLHNNSSVTSWKLSLKQINHLEHQVDLFCTESTNLQKKRFLGLNLVNSLLLLMCNGEDNKEEIGSTLPFCVQYLIDNINTPDFFQNSSISKAIKQMGYTQSYVSHLFKKSMGISISDYVKEKRILHIEYYLRNTSYSLQEICRLIGLKNLSHLNSLFKEKYDISPIKYRKQAKKESLNQPPEKR